MGRGLKRRHESRWQFLASTHEISGRTSFLIDLVVIHGRLIEDIDATVWASGLISVRVLY